MALLGAIVAGGRATRFGSDKGAATLDGIALIDHVARGLRPQVDAIAIVGRGWPGLATIDDHPRPGLGPLGGLCGALRYAAGKGCDRVATTPCDLLPVPNFSQLSNLGGAAVLSGYEICGVWPVEYLPSLEAFIERADKLSMKAWIAHSCTLGVVSLDTHFDLNTPEVLASLTLRR